ncbi:MAG: CpcT/CpeT family chromophore lyase, partial [Woeseiaceae bacterium]
MHFIHRVVATVLITATLHVQAATAADQDQLDRLASLMAGRFDNQAAISDGDAEAGDFLSDWRQKIDAPLLGNAVFYLQLNQGADRDLYRQRILVLSLDAETDSIKQTAYTLTNPEPFADAMSTSDVFAGLGPDDVERMLDDGCAQYWTETDGGFSGHVDPDSCRIISSRTGNPRRIEALTILTATTLDLAERGFDDEGNHLFGSAIGETTQLTRTPPTAHLRSASFVTRDLEASVEFYTTYLGYKELGRSEISADKSRQVVGATGTETVRYVSLTPA